MVRITPTDAAWKDCPRACECSANDCPLTILRFKSDSSDIESKCKLGKTVRLRIGKKWKLSNRGLKPRELSSALNWEKLSEKEKKERTDKLQGNSPITRLSAKGYAIVPKKRVISDTHELNGQIGVSDGVELESVDEMGVKG